MAETPPSAHPAAVTYHQNRTYIRQLALQIEAMARQILLDQAHGRTVPGNGRKLNALTLSLCEAQSVMAAYERDAARLARAA
jgi:hypothetical protein